MICLSDSVEIFSILETCAEDNFDPTKNHHAFFRHEDQFAALLFTAHGKNKGPLLFLVKATHYAALEEKLLPALIRLAGDENFEAVRSAAIAELRNRIESQLAGNFFFDAH